MPVTITETFYAKDRSLLRNWFIKHHETKKEIWLVLYKKHTDTPSVPYDDAVLEALCFGWIDGIAKRLDDKSYVQRFSPRRKKSHWTETNIAKFQKLLKEGLVMPAGIKAFENRLKD